MAVGSTFLAEWTADYLPKSKRMPVPGGQDAKHAATAASTSCSSTAQSNGTVPGFDYDVSAQGFVIAPANAQYHHSSNSHGHQGGCSNLISCAMRSIYRALVSLPASHQNLHSSSQSRHDAHVRGNGRGGQHVHALTQLTGLLWYQGENDCSRTSVDGDGDDETCTASAESYGDRCKAVIEQFRLLATAVTALARMARGEADVDATRSSLRSLIITRAEGDTEKDKSDDADGHKGIAGLDDRGPPIAGTIPVVSVAVTTTRPWLVHLPTIRRQQLAMPMKVDHLSVVDSFGYTLQPDGTNNSQLPPPHVPPLASNTSL